MRKNGQSAVWGGATLGLCVGLAIGIFSGPLWPSAFAGVVIGAGVGAGASALGWASDRLRARGESKQVYVVTEEELGLYYRELEESGITGEHQYLLATHYLQTGEKLDPAETQRDG